MLYYPLGKGILLLGLTAALSLGIGLWLYMRQEADL